MAATSLTLLAVALVSVAPLVSAASDNPYLSPLDSQAAQWASNAAVTYCAGGFEGHVDQEGGRKALLHTLGGQNVFLKVVTNSQGPEHLREELKTEIPPGWLITRLLPILVAIVISIVYLGCCWTACPCCRCCRVCKRERTTNVFVKGLLLVLLAGCLAGIIVAAIRTMSGLDDWKAGFDNTACTAAILLNSTLQGQADPPFIGIMPVLQDFYELDQQLETGSPLLTDLDRMMSRTSSIEESLTVTFETLNLLSAMMEITANTRPTTTTNKDLMHRCQLCEELGPNIGAVSKRLSAGVASALNGARSEVRAQLTPEKRKELQRTLRSSTERVVDFKKSMRDSLSFFVEPGKFDRVRRHVHTSAVYVANAFLAYALVLLAFACCGACAWTAREKYTAGPPERLTVYSRCPHRIACCTWCCAFWFIIPVFLIAGVMDAISASLSGACLVMADLDPELLQDITKGVGLNISGDRNIILTDLVTNCLKPANLSLNANPLDIIFTRDNVTQVKVYMRHLIVTTVRDPIDGKFAAIKALLNGTNISLADSQPIVALRDILADNPVDALLIADAGKMTNDPVLQYLTPRLAVGYATSCHCPDHTVAGDLGALTNATLPGINNFVSQLKEFGTEVPRGDCLKKVLCTLGADVATARACDAGNAYMDLKREIAGTTDLFHCDLFQNADGSDCDPINMANNLGVWVNDCLLTEGSSKIMKRQPRTCGLQEFVSYVQGFDRRIQNVFERLDASSAEVQKAIAEDLNDLVEQYILDVITGIADGMTCGFMPPAYSKIVDTFCYQGVNGFAMIGESYVILAAMITVTAFLMYVIWRRAIDNVNADIARQTQPVVNNVTEAGSKQSVQISL